MSRFAAPTADPHGLRDAARRISRSATELDSRGVSAASAGTAALEGWSGSGDLRDAGFSLERALRDRDPVALLPGWVAGGIYTAQNGAKAHGLLRTRGVAAARYAHLVLQASRFYDLGRPAVAGALLSSAQAERLRDVMTGRGTTGRFAAARTVLGRAFLPLTAVSGWTDAATGGGYDGARGAVTRVAGAAGAVGALALSAAYLSVLALGPVGMAVAAGAVIAYGLWSLGNLVYDHREQIGDFFGAVGSGIATGARHVGEAVGRTVSGARRALADGAAAVVDTGRRVVDVLTSPARLLPSIGGLF